MAARSDHVSPARPGAVPGAVEEDVAAAAAAGEGAGEPTGPRVDPTLPVGVVVRGPTQRLRRIRR